MIGFSDYYYYLKKNTYSGKHYIEQLFVINKTNKNLICATGAVFNGNPTGKCHISLIDKYLFTSLDDAKAGLYLLCCDEIEKIKPKLKMLENIKDTVAYHVCSKVSVVDCEPIDMSKVEF